eukprot:CAMPEP_0113462998 /NCGR_PEP_ID=MMETSP0014_2-20120614/12406_1 /TAXON_ID=2857 /ORGANISM="Nitzschia sp." /LENGTH=383 /DNA_ID=CAMNT_0000354929 /DNA_START=245 /DNA_END=1396 /DNA_ORIENTATION=+ /assembly_acc=CAM_ASM_000159
MGNQPPSANHGAGGGGGSGGAADDPRGHHHHHGQQQNDGRPGGGGGGGQMMMNQSGYAGYAGAAGGAVPGGYGMPPQGGAGGQMQQQQFPPPQQQQQQQQPQTHHQRERSNSDASMTILDADRTAAAVAGSGSGSGGEAWLDDNTVPTVFRWEHGGRQVYITGTFNGWSRQIPMHRSGNDFTYIHNLKRGKHAFKFIVDDEWRFAPDQPTVADIEGRINNFIDVTDFKAYTGDREFEKEKAAAEYGYTGEEPSPSPSSSSPGDNNAAAAAAAAAAGGDGSTAADSAAASTDPNAPDMDGEVFSHTMPDMDEYTKEPPPLPPHLRHIILNKPPQLQDTAALPVPQHVALNHLYCTAIKDNMMVLGITQRYKTKFVTTVYYSPCK